MYPSLTFTYASTVLELLVHFQNVVDGVGETLTPEGYLVAVSEATLHFARKIEDMGTCSIVDGSNLKYLLFTGVNMLLTLDRTRLKDFIRFHFANDANHLDDLNGATFVSQLLERSF